MKLAELACPSCGLSRLIRMRERGHKVACNGCSGVIDVPANLDFPDYVDLYEDRVLAGNVQIAAVLSIVMCCAPAAAIGWWLASGAAQRAADEGRPVDPDLVRARAMAAVTAVIEMVVFLGLGALLIRRW